MYLNILSVVLEEGVTACDFPTKKRTIPFLALGFDTPQSPDREGSESLTQERSLVTGTP